MALKNAIDHNDFAFSAIMFDVDYFKTINDKFGHKTGDEVLESVAEILRISFDKGDIVGRYGGDEFCVITKTVDEKMLSEKIGKVRDAAANINWANKGDLKVSLSAGYAVYDRSEGLPPKEFMEKIDKNMYEEKLQHHLGDRRKPR